jgi:hypothetical protein
LRTHNQVQSLLQDGERLFRSERVQEEQAEIHLARLSAIRTQHFLEQSEEALLLAGYHRR